MQRERGGKGGRQEGSRMRNEMKCNCRGREGEGKSDKNAAANATRGETTRTADKPITSSNNNTSTSHNNNNNMGATRWDNNNKDYKEAKAKNPFENRIARKMQRSFAIAFSLSVEQGKRN